MGYNHGRVRLGVIALLDPSLRAAAASNTIQTAARAPRSAAQDTYYARPRTPPRCPSPIEKATEDLEDPSSQPLDKL